MNVIPLHPRPVEAAPVDLHLSERQKVGARAVLVGLADELEDRGHTIGPVFDGLAEIVRTRTECELIASLCDRMGGYQSAGDTRTALYIAAHALREIVR